MLTTGEVSEMVLTQIDNMSDTCIAYEYSGNITGTDGQLSPYYVTGSAEACGFLSVKAGKIYRGQLIIPEYDAELRMPPTRLIDARSIFVVNSETYFIDAIHKGRTANLYALKQMDI